MGGLEAQLGRGQREAEALSAAVAADEAAARRHAATADALREQRDRELAAALPALEAVSSYWQSAGTLTHRDECGLVVLEHRRVGKKKQAQQLPGTKYHTISRVVGPTSERLERTERELEAVKTALEAKRLAQQASEERLCELEGVLRGAVAEQSSLTDMASCP